MDNRDTSFIHWRDVPAALGLLTRFPVPIDSDHAAARGALAAWAYPVAGLLLGVVLAAAAALMLWAGLPAAIVAALILALSAILTGAMHEDGLADSADGLWGGWDKAQRLDIMKDSHIGVYGVIALALTLLIRWLALVAVIASGGYWAVLIAIGAVSRMNMVVIMAVLPNARDGGLSQRVGRPSNVTTGIAVGIAFAIGLPSVGISALLAACLAGAACGLIAQAKISGQTGDILGATQQITEIAMLLVLLVALG